jgi:hypothetical protein
LVVEKRLILKANAFSKILFDVIFTYKKKRFKHNDFKSGKVSVAKLAARVLWVYKV